MKTLTLQIHSNKTTQTMNSNSMNSVVTIICRANIYELGITCTSYLKAESVGRTATLVHTSDPPRCLEFVHAIGALNAV